MPNLNGHRKALERAGNQAAWAMSRYAPVAVKQALVEKNYDAALEGWAQAIRDREPWALQGWAAAAGAIGVPINVNLFGLASPEEVQHRVELTRNAEAMTDADVVELCYERLIDIARRNRELVMACAKGEQLALLLMPGEAS